MTGLPHIFGLGISVLVRPRVKYDKVYIQGHLERNTLKKMGTFQKLKWPLS